MRKLFMIAVGVALAMPVFAVEVPGATPGVGAGDLDGSDSFVLTVANTTIPTYAKVVTKTLDVSFGSDFTNPLEVGVVHSTAANIQFEANVDLSADLDFGLPLANSTSTEYKGATLPTTATLSYTGWLSGRLTSDAWKYETGAPETIALPVTAGGIHGNVHDDSDGRWVQEFKVRHGYTGTGTTNGGADLTVTLNATRSGLADYAGTYLQGKADAGAADGTGFSKAPLTLTVSYLD